MNEKNHATRIGRAVLLAASFGMALGACGGSSSKQPAPTYPEDPPLEQSEPAPPPAITGEPSAAPAASESDSLTDEKVRTFARAYTEVMTVQVQYQERLQNASSEEELRALEAQGNDEIQQVVADHGMTLQEFEELAQAAATDEAVRERVETELRSLEQ